MDYETMLTSHYHESDSNQDGFLDSVEWLEYTLRNKTRQLSNSDGKLQKGK